MDEANNLEALARGRTRGCARSPASPSVRQQTISQIERQKILREAAEARHSIDALVEAVKVG